MTRPPHAEGDGPTQLIVTALWLFVAIVWVVAAIAVLHAIVPGGVRP